MREAPSKKETLANGRLKRKIGTEILNENLVINFNISTRDSQNVIYGFQEKILDLNFALGYT